MPQTAAFGGLLRPVAAPRPVAGSGSAPCGWTPLRYPRAARLSAARTVG